MLECIIEIKIQKVNSCGYTCMKIFINFSATYIHQKGRMPLLLALKHSYGEVGGLTHAWI